MRTRGKCDEGRRSGSGARVIILGGRLRCGTAAGSSSKTDPSGEPQREERSMNSIRLSWPVSPMQKTLRRGCRKGVDNVGAVAR